MTVFYAMRKLRRNPSTFSSAVILHFNQNFWWKLNLEWNIELGLLNMLMDAKKRYNLICLKESLIVGCCSLWNHRNRSIFDAAPISLEICFQEFLTSVDLVMHRSKPSLKEGMTHWVDTL